MRINRNIGILLIAAVTLFPAIGHADYCVPPKPPAKPAPPDEPCPACEPKECKKCTASPVYLSLGTFTRDETDLSIRTTGLGISVARYYDSGRVVDGPLGIGWTSSLTTRLHAAVFATSNSTYQYKAYVLMPHGAIYEFTRTTPGGAYSAPVGRRDVLVQNADGTYDMTLGDQPVALHFNIDGTLAWMKDEFNNAIQYTYDGNGRVQRIADGAGSGRYVDVTWNSATGRISSVTDSAARTVVYTYNAGNLETVQDAVTPTGEHSSRYTYIPGRFGPVMSLVEDRWNRVLTRVDWDTAGKVKSYTEGEFNDLNPSASTGEKYQYTYSGGSVQRAHSLGSKTYLFNSATGLKINDLATYDSMGQVTSVSDPGAGTTSYTYDSSGRLITETISGSLNSPGVVWTYTYDSTYPKKIATRKASGGAAWAGARFEYYGPGSDAPGALKSVYALRAGGVSEDLQGTFEYDGRGRIKSAVSVPDEPSTYYFYDATGNLETIRRGDSATIPVGFEYDSLGRVTKTIDEAGKATVYTYDAADRILTVTLPKPSAASTLNFVTTYTYDEYDPISGLTFVRATDPNGRVTKQGYDALGNLVQSVDALQNVTTYEYRYNLLYSVTDANGNKTSYGYDANRQLASTTFPDDATETYTSTVNGRRTEVIDRRGNKLKYTYDGFGRILTAIYSGANLPPGLRSLSYSYAGQSLTSVTEGIDSGGRIYSFTHDDRFRVKSEGYQLDTKVEYEYASPLGQLLLNHTIRPPDGNTDRVSTVHFTYDGMRRVSTMSFDGLFPDVTIDYNIRGQYQQIHFANAGDPVLSRNFAYDDQGRLTSISHVHPTAGVLASYEYGYDYDYATSTYTMLGQRTSVTPAAESLTKYKYDAAYQLIEALPPFGGYVKWEYDAIGNRTLQNKQSSGVTAYQYYKNGTNPANSTRLKKVGVAPDLTYDANGNQLAGGAVWDAANRLLQHGAVTFDYDWRSRRAKRLNAKYTYVGENVGRIRDTTASVLDDFIFGPGIDEPLVRKRANGTKNYYVVDGLGSIVSVVDASGTIVESRTYDAWGYTPISGTFGYTGREAGNSGALVYYRARYYDPFVGRFISEDPIRFLSSVNFYSYVDNNAIRYTDPFGLSNVDSVLPKSGPYCDFGVCAPKPKKTNPPVPGPGCFASLSKLSKLNSALKKQNSVDKWKHCVMGCEITKACGELNGLAASYGKEIIDLVTPGDADWKDAEATNAGVVCASSKVGCGCCCKTSGYKP